MDGADGSARRLAPHAVLLSRGPTELQVGVEPSVVVPEAYGPVLRALAATDLPPALLTSLAHEHGLPDRTVPDLLDALDRARLLAPLPPTAGTAVRVVGTGALAARVAHELVLAGVGTLYLCDLPRRLDPSAPRRRRRGRRPHAEREPDAVDLLLARLAGVAPDVRLRRTRHFLEPGAGAVALTLVVADGPEPDRLVTDLLREHGAAHLLVRSGGDEVVVGPLVVPGTTSCVRCSDLARRDSDPCWPGLLDQLTRLALAPTPTLLTWAAVTATVQALAFVAGAAPETLGRTLELGSAEPVLRLRSWPAHPECPCRWDDVDAAGPPDTVLALDPEAVATMVAAGSG